MKFFIWFLCLLVNSIITTFFKEDGITLGAIPTAILWGATMWLAGTLCKKWDEHKENKEAANKAQLKPSPQYTPVKTTTLQSAPIKSTVSQPVLQNPIDDQIDFCEKCGSKLLDNAIFCNKCGTKVVKK